MKNLKQLSNTELNQTLKCLAAEERRITTEVLRHLWEVWSRRLFAELGYSSLNEYAVKELRYCESSASRRIAAMWAMHQVPEVEKDLASGKMSVSTVALAQAFFRREEKEKKTYNVEDKQALLNELAGKSKNESLKVLASISPAFLSYQQEKQTPINATETEIKFIADDAFMKKLSRAKELLGPSSTKELLEKLLDDYLKRKDPNNGISKSVMTKPERQQAVASKNTQSSALNQSLAPEQARCTEFQRWRDFVLFKRYIPEALRRAVWSRDNGQCTFVSPITGKRCCSTRKLELDHVLPHALGGETSIENLRLLCRTHNLLVARRFYGQKKMEKFRKI
jgi:5-methylcytosine-specific restriction endonuclease McrA